MTRRFAAALLAVALLATASRTFVAEPFAVASSSMAPTVRSGDHVLVDKLAFRRGAPARGDLVVLAAPGGGDPLLKRVVALGGQRVELRDGALVVDGGRAREPYVDLEAVDGVWFGPVRVPAGHVFVLGDNRGNSTDSRAFGPVAEEDLVGRVLLRIWPLPALGAP